MQKNDFIKTVSNMLMKDDLTIFKIQWYWNWETKFHFSRNPININNVDIDRTMVTNKFYFSKNKDF